MRNGKITVYFSLPFTPTKRRTHFYHGHMALGINGTVYQLFDPKFLKSKFMVSRMPSDEWLYGGSKIWAHNNPASRTYSWVHLAEIQRITARALDFERKCRAEGTTFKLFSMNCSLFAGYLLAHFLRMEKSPADILPALLFKRILRRARALGLQYEVEALERRDNSLFAVHGPCLGIRSLNAGNKLDRLIGGAVKAAP